MRVYVASPPGSAVGGVASYTTALVDQLPGVTRFNQWWPLSQRSSRRFVRNGVHALGLVRWAAALARRPDLVHLTVTSPGIARDVIYLRMARALRVPAVAHLHTSGFTGDGASPRAVAGLRHIIRCADATVVMSDLAADDICAATAVDRRRVYVVPNPAPKLAPAQSQPREDQCEMTLLCVAELSRLKDQAGLAEAVSRIRDRGHDVRLRLVGPRGDIDDATYARLSAQRGVTLVGVVRGSALTRQYQSVDGYVLFSRSEAEPMSILEAMTCSLPVIGTAVGSIPSTLAAAGEGNVVIAPGDVDALIAALQMWIDDPAQRCATGEANARWAKENRSLARHAERLDEVYTEVLRESHS